MRGFWKRPTLQAPGRIKRAIYKRGHRPGPRSIFYSPSLDLNYAVRDALRETLAGLRPYIKDSEDRMGPR